MFAIVYVQQAIVCLWI